MTITIDNTQWEGEPPTGHKQVISEDSYSTLPPGMVVRRTTYGDYREVIIETGGINIRVNARELMWALTAMMEGHK